VFPLGAGLAKDTSQFPKWWGPVDVGLALVVAIAALGIQVLVRGNVDRRAEDTTYREYRTLTHGIMMLGVFADAGWRSDHLGALRDRFLMAHLAGLVYLVRPGTAN
jgi:hypothetical protein